MIVIDKNPMPVFNKKYKVILKYTYDDHNTYMSMLEWIDKNSNNSVEIKFPNNTNNGEVWYAPAGLRRIDPSIFIGFENADDATFFKIKYSV